MLSQRIGSLSNGDGDGDGDGNENDKSIIFRLVKEQLYLCITLFLPFHMSLSIFHNSIFHVLLNLDTVRWHSSLK